MFTRPHRRRPVTADASVVTLQQAEHISRPSLQIATPDALRPLPQSVYEFNPHEHVEELHAQVRELVAGLAAAGALDQDNLNALTATIASWRATWSGHQQEMAKGRRKVAALLVAQLAENERTARGQLALMRLRRDEIAGLRRDALSELGFPPAEATDADAFAQLLHDDEPPVLSEHLPEMHLAAHAARIPRPIPA